MTIRPTMIPTSEVSETDILAAADAFGAALRASPEFASLQRAGDVLTADFEANAAINALKRRQIDLRTETMLGTLNAAQRAELERLEEAMLACPAVTAYLDAQMAFQAVCRETAEVVSAQIGIDFAANCRAGGCCG